MTPRDSEGWESLGVWGADQWVRVGGVCGWEGNIGVFRGPVPGVG